MNHQNTVTSCSNCLHKTSDITNHLACLISGKTVEPTYSCENFYSNKTNSHEVAQFDFETEKEYFSMKLFRLFTIYLTGLILGTIFLFIGYSDPAEHVLMIVVSTLVILVSAIASIILLYNLWQFTIKELKKHGLTPSIDSPGKAVGFLFIPFFNFYWIFKAIGKLPVEINRIAVTRTGSRVIVNDIGIVLSITTLLSLIPVFGIILVLINSFFLPLYYGLVISAVKNIPYSPENYPVEKHRAEPLDINTIRDYSELFNKKHYGTNLLFGIYYFVASVITQVISISIYYYTHKISMVHFFSGANLLYSVVPPLLLAIVLVILSHSIRNKILLALITGLSQVIVNLVPPAIWVIIGNMETDLIFNKSFITHAITNFTSGILFILSLSTFIRIYGLKIWSIILALLTTTIVSHIIFYTFTYVLEGKFKFEFTGLLSTLIYILIMSTAIYFAFYQYIERTKISIQNESTIP